MTLIDLIEQAMADDGEDRERQSLLLLQCCEQASPQEREKINACLICLCGWSQESLLQHQQPGM
jgi:hypothetical protein